MRCALDVPETLRGGAVTATGCFKAEIVVERVWLIGQARDARADLGVLHQETPAVDAAGSVHLPVNRYYPKGTRVRLHVPAQAPWGSATSSSHRTGS